MRSRAFSPLLALSVLLLTLSCRNLDRFDTKGKAAFCGQLVKAPDFHDGFVPDGQPDVLLTMKLTLDTSQLSSFSADKATQIGALTSDDASEIRRCLQWLKTTDAGTGFMHEAFDQDDPAHFTRAWFAWADSLFGEMIVDLVARHPALLRGHTGL